MIVVYNAHVLFLNYYLEIYIQSNIEDVNPAIEQSPHKPDNQDNVSYFSTVISSVSQLIVAGR